MTLRRTNLIALLLPAALMAGALVGQYVGHLVPCEMCWWQRWPHLAAIALAGSAMALREGAMKRLLIAAAAGGIVTSGLIGIYHAGVEYHWWPGITACTAVINGQAGQLFQNILAAPLIRCDQAQWTLFGISLAGFNALISVPVGSALFFAIAKRK